MEESIPTSGITQPVADTSVTVTPVAAPGPKPANWTAPTERAWEPSSVHVLVKPTGAICNLGCAYCFFLDKELLYAGDKFRMSDETLERYVIQLIDAHDVNQVTMAWQGGEPTLMGIDFYRRAIELAHQHARPGMTFLHTMQTNATLIDEEWCEFFKEHNYLLGISIDGPEHLHNAYRVDKKGRGTFDKVMRGLRLIQKYGIEYNILTTVNRVNSEHPLDVYRFLRDEVGTTWMQFIPVVEREDADGNPADLRGHHVSERSVRPEQFGTFLSTIFEEWIRNDVGTVFVQTIEATARNVAKMGNSGMCVFNETCGTGVALEHNGDLYSCDHFVDPDYFMGNLADATVDQLVAAPSQYEFGQDKQTGLPQYCLDCEVLDLCRGECPKNRFATTPDGEDNLNYLCAGFRQYFNLARPGLARIIELMNHGQPAARIMQEIRDAERRRETELHKAGRNGPCPCGSGKKTKQCHGAANRDDPANTRPAATPGSIGDAITVGVARPSVHQPRSHG